MASAFGRAWMILRQRESEGAAQLAAVLAGGPPLCLWRASSLDDRPAVHSPGLPERLGLAAIPDGESIAGALPLALADRFRAGFAALRRDGAAFRIEVGEMALSGRRRVGWDILELEDLAAYNRERRRAEIAERAIDRATAEAGRLQRMFDRLPVLVWLRRQDLALQWCNRTYAEALDIGREAALETGAELTGGRALAERVRAAGQGLAESRRVVIGNNRHVLEVTEVPMAEEALQLGFAIDRTREEEVRADLTRHISAHAAVLEHMGSAIAIYGPDRRLQFYNQAYARLWGLDESWLATHPGFGEVLEELRTRRRLPEYANFPQFKRENLALFQQLIEPREDLMHLPDGTTLRLLVAPHAFGGLMFVLEDVTTTLALESSYNILMAVQQETLDNLAEGIAVFGSDGRLKLSNPAYARMWRLHPEDLVNEPHISELLDKVRTLLDHGQDWAAVKDEIVAATLERLTRNGRIERTDGSVLDFANVPLPDGAVLATCLDVTDSVRVEQALRAKNAALAEADRLRTEFLANVSYHLRTPLNSIMGFAEMLAGQYFGNLNERQLEYSRNVLASGEYLLSMINDILDLATIEAGYMTLERRPVDVAAVLAGVMSLAQDWTAKQGLRLDLECPAGIGTLQADEKRLKQALFNLVSIAIRQSPPKRTITLAARRDGGEIVFTVRNTGAGLAVPRTRRPGSARDAAAEGTDLALTLVKSFIELHGGRVAIERQGEQGIGIHCILPAD
jgi:signal transduction histidine kinase